MTLKTIATGSTGNCYALKADNGEILLIEAGIPIKDIKRGIDFDIEHLVGVIVGHVHNDHSRSVKDLKHMGVPVWTPYTSDKVRLRTKIGGFKVECFDLPHSVPCRGFVIEVDGLKILYASDFEYIKYSFKDSGINVMLIEMNYQQKVMDGLEIDEHIAHTVSGHASDKTTTEFILHNKKYLQNIILCHYSKSGNLNRDEALEELKGKLPEYIQTQWATPGCEITLGCPF